MRADYAKFMADVVSEGGDDIEDYDTLLIGLEDLVVKPLSLKYLAELEERS